MPTGVLNKQKTDNMSNFKIVSATEATESRFKESPIFKEGLYELKRNTYAWMVPNGSWCESNAGLIVGDGEALLVDTLMDYNFTRIMLDNMKSITRENPIKKVVTTHADPDHLWGNKLVEEAEIICSKACSDELYSIKPKSIKLTRLLGSIFSLIPFFSLPKIGHWLKNMAAPYNVDNIEIIPPNRTFSGELKIDVGGREVILIEAGPAHTEGDVMVYLPDAKVLYTGDLIFNGVTPPMWAGPTENWLSCLNKILEMDVEHIVPGHGAVTDKNGVKKVIHYLEYINDAVIKRHKMGLSVEKAVYDIIKDEDFKRQNFDKLNSPERLMVNAHTIYRHLNKTKKPGIPGLIKILAAQGKLAHSFLDSQPAVMRKK